MDYFSCVGDFVVVRKELRQLFVNMVSTVKEKNLSGEHVISESFKNNG